MKFSSKILAALSAVLLLSACETAPGANNNADGSGGAGGAGGVDSMGREIGYLPNSDVPDRVFFDYDSSVVRGDAQATLQRQAEYLKANGAVGVTIEGHCDERGTREYNIALGERRASAVKRYLSSLGVESGRVNITSYGKERPAVTGSDEASFAQNRRGVTVVTGQ